LKAVVRSCKIIIHKTGSDLVDETDNLPRRWPLYTKQHPTEVFKSHPKSRANISQRSSFRMKSEKFSRESHFSDFCFHNCCSDGRTGWLVGGGLTSGQVGKSNGFSNFSKEINL